MLTKLSSDLARTQAESLLLSLSILPNPDKILNKLGRRIDILHDLLYDAHVSATWQSRLATTASKKLLLETTNVDEHIAAQAEKWFYDLDHERIISELLDCRLFGYQFLEITWRYEKGLFIPCDVIGKPQEWFGFKNNVPYFIRENGSPEELLRYKFLLTRNKATFKNPYGQALLSRCYWHVTFKSAMMKYSMIYGERFAIPWVIESLTQKLDQAGLMNEADQLKKMVQDALIVLNPGASIDIKEASSHNNNPIFQMIYEQSNHEISKAILSQTLTTDIGVSGSYAAANVHLSVRSDIGYLDGRLVINAFDTLLDYFCIVNYGKKIPSLRTQFAKSTEEQRARSERDKNLKTLGVEFSRTYFLNNYSLDDSEIKAELSQ